MPRRSRRLTGTGTSSVAPVPAVSRLERLLDLGGGVLLHPWLRRQDEGRALAALEPVAAPLSALVHRWPWPMLRRWGCIGTGPGQFDDPSGVAISSGGDIVVCDAGNNRVQVFRSDGTFVRQWGSDGAAPGQFQYPASVAVSSADEVFVADHGNCRIQVFHLDGSFVRSWGSHQGEAPGQFDRPAGVAVHGDLVLVSDKGNHRIQCFGLDGTFLRMWGSKGAAPGQFEYPAGLAVSAAGEVFVCDSHNNRVQVFGLDGTLQRTLGGLGYAPGRFALPVHVAVTRAGEVLVSDFARVQAFLAADSSHIRCLSLGNPLVTTQNEPYCPLALKCNTCLWLSGVAVTLTGDVVVVSSGSGHGGSGLRCLFFETAGA